MMGMKTPELTELLNDVKARFASDATGHDYAHTLRVYKSALSLQAKEGGDLEVITLASLLHDVDDYKLFKGDNYAQTWLNSHHIPQEVQQKVVKIIAEISFKGSDTKPASTLEGKIVQDADRLDALGAIGIARAFAYGGAKGRVMFDPAIPPVLGMNEKEYKAAEGTTINHFYEKLFLLQDLMNTEEGKRLAKARTDFMKRYLEEFYLEWEEKDLQ